MQDTEVAELIDVLNAGFPPVHEMSGVEARATIAARRQPVQNIDDVERVEDREVPAPHGAVGVRFYFPHGSAAASLPVVVFFHGGGFVFCDIESHDGFCREMAKETRSIVVSVDYRLAPEHRAPAAAQDAHTTLAWVLEHAAEFGGDPRRVVTAGDSAGGNLATVACMMIKESGGREPAGQVLIYPMLDPSCASESYEKYATGYVNTKAAMEWYWRQYLDGGPIPRPEHHVAPLTASNLAGLPPAVVVTAGWDPLSSEGTSYVAALRRAGVPVLNRSYPELFHGFLTIAPLRAAQSARTLLWRDLRSLITSTDSQEVTA